MTEEEKKAIEALKYCVGKTFGGYDKYYFEDNSSMMIYRAIQIVLNLIKKQQKEIEKLNTIIQTDNIINKERAELIEEQIREIEDLKGNETYKLAIIDKEKYISKDKIREKIQELEKIIEFEKPTYEETLEYAIEILQLLLEED